MARLPAQAQFDELNGSEVREILLQRLAQVLDQVPYLQRHITLPRVRMTLQVELACWADQQGAEVQRIADEFTIHGVGDPLAQCEPDAVASSTDMLDASPGPPAQGHKPPDQFRDEFGLERPVRMPSVLPRDPLPPIEPPAPSADLPGVRIERGTGVGGGHRGTFVTQDRGGPAAAGAPVEPPTFRNAGRGSTESIGKEYQRRDR